MYKLKWLYIGVLATTTLLSMFCVVEAGNPSIKWIKTPSTTIYNVN